MTRPKLCRRVCCEPGVSFFKPAGVRLVDLEESVLPLDEFEALRLKDLEGLDQDAAAGRMGISQPTFHRLVSAARKRLADAIVNGKAIRIEGGVYQMAATRTFRCAGCAHGWKVPFGTGRPHACPKCKSRDIHRSADERDLAGMGRGQDRCRGIR
jgi:uncharacterized protein